MTGWTLAAALCASFASGQDAEPKPRPDRAEEQPAAPAQRQVRTATFALG